MRRPLARTLAAATTLVLVALPARGNSRTRPTEAPPCDDVNDLDACFHAASVAAAPVAGPAPIGPTAARLAAAADRLPLLFERNEGQVDGRVDFLCRTAGMTLFLAGGEAVVALRNAGDGNSTVVRLALAGAAAEPRAEGEEEQPARSNYLRGADPTGWHTGVANFAAVRYPRIYPGIDLVYHGDEGRLEYDFVVAPGGRPERIRLRVDGVDRLEVGSAGELRFHTGARVLVQEAPVAYQEGPAGKRRSVAARYELAGGAGGEVRLAVGSYDRARPLVIDPVILYGTYLGGTGVDIGQAIAVDAAGNAYVTGGTSSPGFPGTASSPLQPSLDGPGDVFVTKLDPTGTAIVYSTYLGGSSAETAYAIAVDAAGNAYVTGHELHRLSRHHLEPCPVELCRSPRRLHRRARCHRDGHRLFHLPRGIGHRCLLRHRARRRR